MTTTREQHNSIITKEIKKNLLCKIIIKLINSTFFDNAYCFKYRNKNENYKLSNRFF